MCDNTLKIILICFFRVSLILSFVSDLIRIFLTQFNSPLAMIDGLFIARLFDVIFVAIKIRLFSISKSLSINSIALSKMNASPVIKY